MLEKLVQVLLTLSDPHIQNIVKANANEIGLYLTGGCPAVLVGCANEQSEAEARTAVADLAARLGVGWIDARSFDAPDEWFADSAHFNRTGTLRYTEFIAASLADR